MSVERRFTPGRLEVRGTENQSIGGYAAVFNKLSRSLGGFVEELIPSVFNRAAADGWQGVICRYNHDDMALLGTTGARTLRLSTDGYGLMYEVDPPQARADIAELVQRGDITKSSFAFMVVEDDWGLTDQGYPKRTLQSVELVDVSPVVSPAYVDTSVGLRSLATKFDAPFEEIRKMAEDEKLVKLFTRSDVTSAKVEEATKKKVYGPAARMLLLGRAKDPLDN